MPWLGVLGERLRSRLWPIPALLAVLSAVLAVVLSRVRSQPSGDSSWWPAEASSARGLLEVLAGSSLTVVALVFSLHVVSLQLAASQYSPRLLRTYARDLVVQLSLAVLIATFVFSLVTLTLFGSTEEPPRVSVAAAVAMGLGSVAALVGVVGHIVSSLRVETMMAELHADASAVIRRVYDIPDNDRGTASSADLPEGARAFHAAHAGFLQSVDAERLADWAEERDVLVVVEVSPGRQVLAGDVIGHCHGTRVDVDDDLTPMVLIGHERTPDEDPGLGLVQLVDISLRALSPGVNDPTTALHAIGHLTSLLVEMAHMRAEGVSIVRDSHGTSRVMLARPTLGEHVEATCLPLIRAGASDPQVLLAVADLLAAVHRVADPSATPVLRRTAHYAQRAARRGLSDTQDLEPVMERLDDVAAVP